MHVPVFPQPCHKLLKPKVSTITSFSKYTVDLKLLAEEENKPCAHLPYLLLVQLAPEDRKAEEQMRGSGIY